MIPIWAQWLFGAVPFGILAGGALAWLRLSKRMDRLEWTTSQIADRCNGQLTLMGSLVAFLNEDKVLAPERTSLLLGHFTDMAKIGPVSTNPISFDEQQRLNAYIELARAGGPFTSEQVAEYRALVARLEEEKPSDPQLGAYWRWVRYCLASTY